MARGHSDHGALPGALRGCAACTWLPCWESVPGSLHGGTSQPHGRDPSGLPWTQGHLGQVCTSCLCDVTGQVPRPLTAMCLCGQLALTVSSVHVGTQLCIMSLPQGPLSPDSNPAASIHVHWHHSLCLDRFGGSRLPALLPDASHGKVAFPVIRELPAAHRALSCAFTWHGAPQVSSLPSG